MVDFPASYVSDWNPNLKPFIPVTGILGESGVDPIYTSKHRDKQLGKPTAWYQAILRSPPFMYPVESACANLYKGHVTGLAFPFFPCQAGCTPLQMSTLSEVSGGIEHTSALSLFCPCLPGSIMKCDKSWHLVLCHCSVQLCHLATRNRWAVVLHWGMSGLQAPHKQKSKQLCLPEKWTRLGEDRSMKYHDASEKIHLWSKFAFPTSLISVVEDWT